MDMYYTCPTCSNVITKNKKYPTEICDECWYLTKNKNGRDIHFANKGINGRFLSMVGEKVVNQHQCFVNGIECYADEGKYGGIIIEAII